MVIQRGTQPFFSRIESDIANCISLYNSYCIYIYIRTYKCVCVCDDEQ